MANLCSEDYTTAEKEQLIFIQENTTEWLN